MCMKVGSASSDMFTGRFEQLRIEQLSTTDFEFPANVNALGLKRKSELTMRGLAPVDITAGDVGPPLPPNVKRQLRITLEAVAVEVNENAVPQFPAAGEVAELSALVSPAVASSLYEVNVMRFEPPGLPTALSVPPIENAVPLGTLITTWGWIASVIPTGTVIVPVLT